MLLLLMLLLLASVQTYPDVTADADAAVAAC